MTRLVPMTQEQSDFIRQVRLFAELQLTDPEKLAMPDHLTHILDAYDRAPTVAVVRDHAEEIRGLWPDDDVAHAQAILDAVGQSGGTTCE